MSGTAADESGGRQRRPREMERVRRSKLVWDVSKFGLWLFSKLWFRLRIEGAENVPATGPVLMTSNHASYLDPPLVGIATPRWIAYLAQSGLAKLGPMRWWLAQVGVTLIDRNAPSKDAMRLVADQLRAGEVVCIFPEGTRTDDGTVAPFRTGVEFLVRRSGACVVPVGIEGSFRAFPRGALLPRPRKVIVRVGEPWSAERVLAPGGVEALRRLVAELARAPLRNSRSEDSRSEDRRSSGSSDPSSPADQAADASSSAGSGT